MAPKLTLQSTVRLNTGHAMPRLGFGLYEVPPEKTQALCEEALKVGYRHLDSASGYWNQAESAAAIASSGIPREQVFYTTKVSRGDEPTGMSYEKAMIKVKHALEVTKLNYLDLVLIHSPLGGTENRLGAWKALVELVEAGKIRSIGVSNFGVAHLEELEAYIKELEAERGGPGKGGKISVNQIELHPWLHRDDIVDWCRKRDVVVQAYCPIVRGQRWGEPKVVALASKYGKTEAQVMLRWSLQKGYVPLIRTVTPARIAENADLYDFELTEEEVADLQTDEYHLVNVQWDPTKTPLDQ